MKRHLTDLAFWGGSPLFTSILPVGQLHLPTWDRFKTLADGIFKRRYYANHWVLTQALEESLCQLLQVRHVVAVTNATIGLSLACKALNLEKGSKIVVPAFTFAASVQACSWAGLEPVFCDINPDTHCINAETVASVLCKSSAEAVLGVHLWGNACDIDGLSQLCEQKKVKLFFDAAHAIGCTYHGKPIGNYGACEIFSFHATKILSATEGGCIATNDDILAEKLRNLRSSYGRRTNVKIPINGNGRFSELQAAFALLSLEDFPQHCEENKQKTLHYIHRLEDVPGLRIIRHDPNEKQNYQYVVIEIDKKYFGLTCEALVRLLTAENIHARRYFVPGMHRCPPYSEKQGAALLPNTDTLCERVLQLPSGAAITLDAIDKICSLIMFIQKNAKIIAEKLP